MREIEENNDDHIKPLTKEERQKKESIEDDQMIHSYIHKKFNAKIAIKRKEKLDNTVEQVINSNFE